VRFRALACDFDGTIATDGVVAAATLTALESARRSGRRVILVTGRTRRQLEVVFARWQSFDRIVLENGALVVDPVSGAEQILCDPVSTRLVAALGLRGVEPLAVGRAICATGVRHLEAVREAVRGLGLPLELVVNRDGVVVLPAGVSKASGLRTALAALGEPMSACVAVGDAENDLPMLAAVGCGVAVANALGEVREMADLRLSRPNGAGILDLVGRLVADDLAGASAAAGGAGAAPR
jgi:hypothetical protein